MRRTNSVEQSGVRRGLPWGARLARAGRRALALAVLLAGLSGTAAWGQGQQGDLGITGDGIREQHAVASFNVLEREPRNVQTFGGPFTGTIQVAIVTNFGIQTANGADVEWTPRTTAGRYGDFVLIPRTGGGSNGARADWTYTINSNHPDVRRLNRGQTLFDTFTVRARHRDTAVEDQVTLRILPVYVGGTLTGRIVEGDASSIFGNMIVANNPSGSGITLQSETIDLRFGRARIFVNSAGQLSWTYTLMTSQNFRDNNWLDRGQVVTERFRVRARSDLSGGIVQDAEVAVTVVGSGPEPFLGEFRFWEDGVAPPGRDPTPRRAEFITHRGQFGNPENCTGLLYVEVDNAGTGPGSGSRLSVEQDGSFTWRVNHFQKIVQTLAEGETLVQRLLVRAACSTSRQGFFPAPRDYAVELIIVGRDEPPHNRQGSPYYDEGRNGFVQERDLMDTASGRLEWGFGGEHGVSNIWANVGTLTSRYGRLAVDARGRWTYTLNTDRPIVQALRQSEDITDGFTLVPTDGRYANAYIGISIYGENDPPAGTITGDRRVVRAGDVVNLRAAASDPDTGETDTLHYEWTVSPSAGRFADPTAASTTWTAPDFVPGGQQYTISLSVTDIHGAAADIPALILEADSTPDFGGARITPIFAQVGEGIPEIHLPEPFYGEAPLRYSINPPLPPGVVLRVNEDRDTGHQTRPRIDNQGDLDPRVLQTYAYRVTDANGDTDDILFTLEVLPREGGRLSDPEFARVSGDFTGTVQYRFGDTDNNTIRGDLDFRDTGGDFPETSSNSPYGDFRIADNGEWTYTAADRTATFNLREGERVLDVFTVMPGQFLATAVTIEVIGQNDPPRDIHASASPTSVPRGASVRLSGGARDPDPGDVLSYRWHVGTPDRGARHRRGVFTDRTAASTTWVAPDVAGRYPLIFTARDPAGRSVSRTVTVTVTGASNAFVPEATIYRPGSGAVLPAGAAVALEGAALDRDGFDTDNNRITYRWSVSPDRGELRNADRADAEWVTPLDENNNDADFQLTLEVTDGARSRRVTIPVRVAGYRGAHITAAAVTEGVGGAPSSVTGVSDLVGVAGNDRRFRFLELSPGDGAGSLEWGTLTLENGVGPRYTYTLNNDHPEVDGLNEGEAMNVGLILHARSVTNPLRSARTLLSIRINGANDPPVASIAAPQADSTLVSGRGIPVRAVVEDPDDDADSSTYEWRTVPAGMGEFADPAAAETTWTAPTVLELNRQVRLVFTATDSGGASSTVSVDPMVMVARPPVIVGDLAGEVTEDAAANTVSGQLRFGNAAPGGRHEFRVTNVQGRYGLFSMLDSTGRWEYTLNNADPDTDGLDGGRRVTDTFRVSNLATSDAGDIPAADVVITVVGAGSRHIGDFRFWEDNVAPPGQPANPRSSQRYEHTGRLDLGSLPFTCQGFDTVDEAGTGPGSGSRFSLDFNGNFTWSVNHFQQVVQTQADGDEIVQRMVVRAVFCEGFGSVDLIMRLIIMGRDEPPHHRQSSPYYEPGRNGFVQESNLMDTASGRLEWGFGGEHDVRDIWANVGTRTSRYGRLEVDARGRWTYTLNTDRRIVQALRQSEDITDGFTLVPTDGRYANAYIGISIYGENDPPAGTITGDRRVVRAGDVVNLRSTASDPDTGETDTLHYEWSVSPPAGRFADRNAAETTWTAPDFVPGGQQYTIRLRVTDVHAAEADIPALILEADSAPDFGGVSISPIIAEVGAGIPDIHLPVPRHGEAPLRYSIIPQLPPGVVLRVDEDRDTGHQTRPRIDNQGDLDVRASALYTYRVTDANGDTDEIRFYLTVVTQGVRFIRFTGDLTGTVQYRFGAGDDNVLRGDVDIANGFGGAANQFVGFSADGRYGNFRIETNGEWTYTATPTQATTALLEGERALDEFQIRTGGPPADAERNTISIEIIGQNDPPRFDNINVNPATLPKNGRTTVSPFNLLDADPRDRDPLSCTWRVVQSPRPVDPGRFDDRSACETIWTAPNVAGDYRLGLTVRDSIGREASRTQLVRVEDRRPMFEPPNNEIDDQLYPIDRPTSTVLPQAVGDAGRMTYRVTPALPFGLDFDPDTRRLFGVPSVADTTVHTYEVAGADRQTARLQFEVEVDGPPSFLVISHPLQTFTVGRGLSTTMPGAEGGNAPLTYTITPPLPDGITLHPTTRLLSGTATTAQDRTRYTYTVSDSDANTAVSDTDSLTFNIVVDGAPDFGDGTIDRQIYTAGADIGTRTLPEATGGNGQLRYAISPPLPAGLTFTEATRALSGEPDTPQGAATYTYTVTDGDTNVADFDTDSLEFTILVTSPDAVPGGVNGLQIIGSGVNRALQWQAPGNVANGTVVLSSYQVEANLLNRWHVERGITVEAETADQQVYFISNFASFVPGALDAPGFRVRAVNLNGSGPWVVVGDAPTTAAPDFGSDTIPAQTYTAGAPVTLSLPQASDGNGVSRYAITPPLPNGLTFDEATRTLSGAPDAPRAAATHTYTVTDADGDSDSLTFTILVTSPTDVPGAVNAFTTNANTAAWQAPDNIADATVALVDYELQANVRNLWQALAALPETTGAAQTYTFTASDRALNAAGYRVRARNTNGAGVWTVSGTAQTPSEPRFGSGAGIDPQTFAAGAAIANLDLPAATGGNGALQYAITPTLPDGLSLSGRTLSGTPGAFQFLSTFTYTVTDSDDNTAAADRDSLTFTILITSPGGIPDLTTLPVVTGAGSARTLTWQVPGNVDGGVVAQTGYELEANVLNRWQAVETIIDDGSVIEHTFSLAAHPPAVQNAPGYRVRAFNDNGPGPWAPSFGAVHPMDSMPRFGSGAGIDPQTFAAGMPITAVQLPQGMDGNGPLRYAITPTLPDGLTFTESGRMLAGIPAAAQATATYTYTVTDSDDDTAAADTAALEFTILVTMPGGVPDMVGDISISGSGVNRRLEWSRPGNVADGIVPLTGYEVEANVLKQWRHVNIENTDGSFASHNFNLGAYSTEVQNAPGFRARAVNDNGEGPWRETGTAPQPAAPTFGGETIAAQTYMAGVDTGGVTLPQATDGNGPLGYAITPPLPSGLQFDAAARELSGTPDAAQAVATYTYTASDSDANTAAADTASLTFTILITAPSDAPGAVTGLSVTGAGNTRALEWQAPANIADSTVSLTGYEIQANVLNRWHLETTLEVAETTAGAQTFNLAAQAEAIAAAPGYRVRARNANGAGPWTATGDTPSDSAPAFADTFSDQIYDAGAAIGSVVLPQASDGNGALRYTLSPAPPGGLTFTESTRALSGMPDSPQPAATYTYTVTDSDSDTGAADRASLTFTILVRAPDALPGVVNTVAFTGSGASRVLTWAAPDNIANGTVGLSAYEIQANVLNRWQTETTVTVTANTPAAQSYDFAAQPELRGALGYRVRARNANGVGPWVAAGPAVAPSAPAFANTASIPARTYAAGENIAGVETGALPQAQTGTGNGALGYAITPTLPDGVVFTEATRRLSGVPDASRAAATYTYTVTDADADTGATDSDSLTFTILVTAPAAFPGAVNALAAGSSALTWQAPNNVADATVSLTGYEIEANVLNRWQALTSVTAATAAAQTYTLTASDLALGAAGWRVRARNTNGAGPWADTGTTPNDEAPTFGGASIIAQTLTAGMAISPALTLPAATGGNGALDYAITPPLPDSLSFDAAARTLSGAADAAQAITTYTYTVTDGDADTAATDSDSLTFTILVTSPSGTPGSVNSLAFSGAGASRSLTWQAPDNVADDTVSLTGYEIQANVLNRWETERTLEVPVSTDAAQTFGLSGQPAAVQNALGYRVRAVNTHGRGPWADAGAAPNDEAPDFGGASIAAQTLTAGTAVSPALTLPAATGGNGALRYAISPPLPGGLSFDESDRMLSGTPGAAQAAATYTYTVSDSDNDASAADTASLTFTILVSSPGGFPGAVNGLQVTGAGAARRLTWAAPANVAGGIVALTGYDIQANVLKQWRDVTTLSDTGGGMTFTYTPAGAGQPDEIVNAPGFRVRAANANGPGPWTVAGTAVAPASPAFPGDANIDDRQDTVGAAIAAVTLPQGMDGNGRLRYAITPTLPPGLNFDETSRRLSGTPTAARETATYTYTVSDSDSDTSAADTAALTFAVTVAPAPSTDAALSALSISPGSLSPGFDAAALTYTAAVANGVESLSVTPTASDAAAVIGVTANGASLTAGAGGAYTAPLNLGVNAVVITVTAEDSATTRAYTLNVDRATSAENDLRFTMLPAATYTFTEGQSVNQAVFRVAGGVGGQTVQTEVSPNLPAGISASSGNAGRDYSFTGAPTAPATYPVTLTVSGGGALNTLTAQVTIVVMPSGGPMAMDAGLSALAVSPGALTPGFAAGTLTYAVSVENDAAALSVTPTANVAAAAIAVTANDAPVTAAGGAYAAPLEVGANTIGITVTATNGIDTRTYTLSVLRALPRVALAVSDDAIDDESGGDTAAAGVTLQPSAAAVSILLDLTPLSGAVSGNYTIAGSGAGAGGAATVGGSTRYTIAFPASANAQTHTLTFSALPDSDRVDNAVRLALVENPAYTISGTAAGEFTIAEPAPEVTLSSADPRATEANAADPAALTLTAAQGANADYPLAAVRIQITPAPDANDYRVLAGADTLSADTASAAGSAIYTIRLAGRGTDNAQTLNVRALDDADGVSESLTVTLLDGDAYDPASGQTALTLTLADDDVASDDATLSALTLAAGELSPGFAAGTLAYTAAVGHETASLSFVPTANHNAATLAVTANDAALSADAAGAYAAPLNEGANTIVIMVTAGDGMAAETYTLTVTRAGVPVITADAVTGALAEDGALTAGGALVVANAGGDTGFVPQTATASAYGIFTLTAEGAWAYTLDNNAAQALRGGQEVTETFTATASAAVTPPVTQTITITLTGANDAPTAVGTLPARTIVAGGRAVTLDVSASFADPDSGDTLTYSAAVSPSGFADATVDAAGLVTITPVAEGAATVSVTAADGATPALTATQTIAVTVAAAGSAILSGNTVFTIAENAPVDTAVAGALPEAENFPSTGSPVWSIVNPDPAAMPFGIDPGTGRLSATAALDHETTASYRLTIRLTRDGVMADLGVTVTVTDVNDPPVAMAGMDQRVTAGDTVLLSGMGADQDDGDTIESYTWSAPAGIVFAGNNANTADGPQQSFTAPSVSEMTQYDIGLVVADSNDVESPSDRVMITVTPDVARGMTAALSGLVTTPGGAVSGFDPGVFTYAFTVGAEIDSITVTPSTDTPGAVISVLGDPVAGGAASGAIPLIEDSETGIIIVVTAEDGLTVVTYTLNITRAPTLVRAAVAEDGDLTASGRLILGHPGDPASRLFAAQTRVNAPTAVNNDRRGDDKYGEFALAADGAWTYTLSNTDPDTQALRQGAAVTRTFTAVSRAMPPVTREVVITITGANDPPRAVGAVGVRNVVVGGADSRVDMTARFTDDSGDTLTYSLDGSMHDTGIATATIVAGELDIRPVGMGTTTFTVTATDAAGETAGQEIEVIVHPAGTQALTGNTAFTIPENSPVGAEVDGPLPMEVNFAMGAPVWSITAPDAPPFTIDADTGRLAVATAVLDHETTPGYTLTIRLTQGAMMMGETEVIIAVTDVNEAPMADAGDPQAMTEGVEVTLDGSRSSDPDPADVLTYIWRQTAGPAGGSLTNAGRARATFTPVEDGAYTFMLEVSDGALTDTATVTFNTDDTLSGLEIAPGTLAPAFTPARTRYTAAIRNAVETLSVTPTLGDAADARLRLTADTGGGPREMSDNGMGDYEIRLLEGGDTTIRITVTAEAGNAMTYTLLATRDAPGPTPEETTMVNAVVLPEVARAVTANTVGAIAGRIRQAWSGRDAAGDGAGRRFTLGGQSTLAQAVAVHGQALADGTLDLPTLLGNTSFVLPLNDTATGLSRLTLWGSGQYRNLSGESGAVDWDGDLISGQLGADARLGRDWLAGIALSRSHSAQDYTVTTGLTGGAGSTGEHALTLTSVHPYLGWSSRDQRLDLWATAGYGWGDVEIASRGTGNVRLTAATDAALYTVGVGGSGQLLETPLGALRLKAEVTQTRLDIDGNGAQFTAMSVEARRARLGLEATQTHALANGGQLHPSVEAGVRHDAGDGRTGAGAEVGGSLRYVSPVPGLTLEGRGRVLLGHSGDYEDWGVGGVIRLEPGAGGQGLVVSLAPAWGQTASGVGQLWTSPDAPGTGAGAGTLSNQRPRGGQVDFLLGYGVPGADAETLLTPYARLTLGDESTRAYRLGGRLRLREWLMLNLEGTRQETATNPVEHGVLLKLGLGW